MSEQGRSTSLSALLGRKVDVTIPNIMVESVEKVPEIMGGGGRTASVIYFLISGKVSGSIILVLSSSESLKLVSLLTGKKISKIENLDEMGLSALKELGNIIIGSYVRVLAEGLKVRIAHSIPGFAYDMLGAVLDEILARMSLATEHAVIMESEFVVRGEVRRLFRCAHTIKSSSGSVGFDDLEKVTQSLERIFQVARDKSLAIGSDVIPLLMESADLCERLLRREEVTCYEELLERLKDVFPV